MSWARHMGVVTHEVKHGELSQPCFTSWQPAGYLLCKEKQIKFRNRLRNLTCFFS